VEKTLVELKIGVGCH